MSNLKNIKKFKQIINKKFGKIDILINNIGHTLNVKDPFCSIEDWKKVMNLNFFTSVNVINNFIDDMKKIIGVELLILHL